MKSSNLMFTLLSACNALPQSEKGYRTRTNLTVTSKVQKYYNYFGENQIMHNIKLLESNDDYLEGNYAPLTEEVLDTIVSSLLHFRPAIYTFRDSLPYSVIQVAMQEEKYPDNFILWVAIGNNRRCLGGYEYHYRTYESFYNPMELSCEEVKKTPLTISEREGYKLVDVKDYELWGYRSFFDLYFNEPDRFEFMRTYLPAFSVRSYAIENIESPFPIFIVDLSIWHMDGITCLAEFSAEYDSLSSIVLWSEEAPCPS